MSQTLGFTSLENINRVQSKALTEQLHYLSQYSPFYRKMFEEFSVSVQTITGLADLKKLPTTQKADLQKENDNFLACPKTDIVEWVSTSGTLGKPVSIGLTKSDVERLAYNECCSFMCIGAQPSDVFQLMLTLDRQFMAGLAYYEGIRKLDACAIRVGPGVPSMQWDSIFQYNTSVLIAVPSFILKMLDYAKEHKISYTDSAVKKIVCIGENIRHLDLRTNPLAERITDQWNVELFSTYASTEMQTAFTECSLHCGGHHLPELIIIEILNANNEEVQDGEIGEVTITNLGVKGMPLLRYRTGDMATKYTEPCKCGRNSMRISPIAGRKQQMIKWKGTTLYPQGIFEILQSHSEVKDFVVEVFTGELETDELRLYVSTDLENESVVKKIF